MLPYVLEDWRFNPPNPTSIKIVDIRLPIGEAGLYAGVEVAGPAAVIIADLVDHGVLAITAGEKYEICVREIFT